MPTQDDVPRGFAAAMRPGWPVAVAAVLAVAIRVWIGRGAFVPITVNDVVEYVFISATARSFVVIALATAVVLLLAHLVVRRLEGRRGARPPFLSREDVAYLKPLWCFGVSTLAALNLIRPHGRFLAVLSYVVVDCRWWWTAMVGFWLGRRIHARVRWAWRGPIARVELLVRAWRWLPEATIAVITMTWVVCGSPILRDYGGTIGDEPKYVRYCENLYQGLGFDVAQIKPMAELPADFQPQLWRNVVLLADVLPGDLRELASDAATFVRDPSHQFNRARHREGGFLDGKDGGMYQVHTPGLSFLMFPAYLVDRTFTPIQPGSPEQWPTNLRAVNAFFVAVYACWTIVIFRFLRKCGAATGIAWLVSLASTLTMPASAFPFQYYPELAAGLFITAVGAHILFGDPRRLGRSFFFGLLVGYLPWFHVRFIIVAAALAFAALVLWRGQRRRAFAFVAAAAIPAVLFCLYSYRITGSVMPSAVWMAEGSEANFNLVGMLKNSVGYLLDREWGLFAHSPVFLLAVPGYWWLARRAPRIAFVSALVFLALLLPAAGKTLVQTAPMRLIVAVVPLGAVPMIEWLGQRSRARLIAFGLLLVVSLDNALAYNFHHYRNMDTLVDWSFSGWKVNLLFPKESRRPWLISASNGVIEIAWIVVVLTLFCAPALVRWARQRRLRLPSLTLNSGPLVGQIFGAVGLFIVLGTAVSAATGVWTAPRYLIPSADAAQQAALMVDDLRTCTLCLSSISGSLNARRMLADLNAVDPLVATRQRAAEVRDYQAWVAMPGQIRAWYSAANGHPPSDSDLGHFLYQWREDHVAAAEIRQRIFAAAGKTP